MSPAQPVMPGNAAATASRIAASGCAACASTASSAAGSPLVAEPADRRAHDLRRAVVAVSSDQDRDRPSAQRRERLGLRMLESELAEDVRAEHAFLASVAPRRASRPRRRPRAIAAALELADRPPGVLSQVVVRVDRAATMSSCTLSERRSRGGVVPRSGASAPCMNGEISRPPTGSSRQANVPCVVHLARRAQERARARRGRSPCRG